MCLDALLLINQGCFTRPPIKHRRKNANDDRAILRNMIRGGGLDEGSVLTGRRDWVAGANTYKTSTAQESMRVCYAAQATWATAQESGGEEWLVRSSWHPQIRGLASGEAVEHLVDWPQLQMLGMPRRAAWASSRMEKV